MDSLADDLMTMNLTNDIPTEIVTRRQWDIEFEALQALKVKVPWIVQYLRSDHQYNTLLVCDMAERLLHHFGDHQSRQAYIIQRDEEGPMIACTNILLNAKGMDTILVKPHHQ